MNGFWTRLVAAFLVAIPAAQADGPPVDVDGRVFAERVILHLSQAEQAEVGRWRTLTLSTAHGRALRKRMRRVPEVLQIVTFFYDDCTCEMPVYGIWNRPFEVAVPIEPRPKGLSPDEFERKRTTRKEEVAIRAAAGRRTPEPHLVMDLDGILYSNGRALTLADALRIVDGLTAKDWENDSLYVDRSPNRDPATTARIRETLATLSDYCKKKGMRFFGGREDQRSASPTQ
jgi:hypothetical protein